MKFISSLIFLLALLNTGYSNDEDQAKVISEWTIISLEILHELKDGELSINTKNEIYRDQDLKGYNTYHGNEFHYEGKREEAVNAFLDKVKNGGESFDNTYMVNVRMGLDKYDFKGKQFPIHGPTPTTSYDIKKMSRGLSAIPKKVSFTNSEYFTHMPMEPDDAEKLITELGSQSNRYLYGRLFFKFTKWDGVMEHKGEIEKIVLYKKDFDLPPMMTLLPVEPPKPTQTKSISASEKVEKPKSEKEKAIKEYNEETAVEYMDYLQAHGILTEYYRDVLNLELSQKASKDSLKKLKTDPNIPDSLKRFIP